MYAANHLQRVPTPPPTGFTKNTAIYRPPFCECADCEQQFLTRAQQHIDRSVYRKEISQSEAKLTATARVQSMNENRAYLKQCLTHGDMIMSRWRKKSRDKRETLLLSVDSTIYSQQWFHFRLPYSRMSWREARKYRNAWLLPYLNLESLKTDPDRLLGLLSNRVAHSPESWAPYDNKQMTLGWESGAFDLDHCESCVIMHGAEYGCTVAWDKAAAHRWDIVGYPRAILILEAQEYIMQLLRRIVDELLEGIDISKAGSSAKWIQTTSLGFKQTDKIEFWSPYLNRPFSAPPLFDIANLVSLTRAKKEAAEDHLWLLQTDPSYMRHVIKDFKAGSWYEDAGSEAAYRMLSTEIFYEFEICIFWQEVLEESENVQTQYCRFRDQINPGERLPPKYNNALGAFELLLTNGMHHMVKHLGSFIPQRPGFRQHWTHDHYSPGHV